MDYAGLIAAVLTALLGAGGLGTAWVNLKYKDKTPLTTATIDAKAADDFIENSGIAERWKAYADDIEKRLNIRIDEYAQELHKAQYDLARARRAHSIAIDYATGLRQHIVNRLEPPPPAWPEDINL